jgi:amidase
MDLVDLGIADLQERLAAGAATSEEAVAAFLERIEALDRNGPTLRSVIETNPDALAIAADLDRERRERGARGPLHGIPILVKDNLDTGDAMMTTAGSLALLGHRAEHDAAVVGRLRAAGAVLLGKTNLSEWANFRSTRSASGWSSRGGQTRNPYALDRSPCGSSSGSGAAVAAHFATAAIGTETDGSVVCPAATNGIVGLKPTVGLVSRAGIIPISTSQDTAGPMTRTVEDAALVLSAIAGSDGRDAATSGADAHVQDYRAALRDDALRGARIGVVRALFGRHEGCDAVAERALEVLREGGAILVDDVDLGGALRLRERELDVLLYEFRTGLDAYLAAHPGAPVRSLEELVAFNEAHAGSVMPYFRQELFEMALATRSWDEGRYEEARRACLRLSRDEGIDAALRQHALDAFVAPTTAPAWTIDPISGDRILGSASGPAAVAGYPHLTVPAGEAFGLPIGLSFFGGAYREATLLAFGHAFERATRARRPPTFPERVV